MPVTRYDILYTVNEISAEPAAAYRGGEPRAWAVNPRANELCFNAKKEMRNLR